MPDDLLDLMHMATEPLVEELDAYVEDNGPMGMPMLRHPLVYQVPFLNSGMANKTLRLKREALDKAVREGDFHSAVFLHERPYRTMALIHYAVGTNEFGVPFRLGGCNPEIRALAAEVWKDSENLEDHEDEWRVMLGTPGLILCDDAEGYARLPEWVEVYRGDIDDAGMSWSMSRDVADWFAKRFDGNAPLLKGRVHKTRITGYLFGRGEQEILVNDDANVIDRERVND